MNDDAIKVPIGKNRKRKAVRVRGVRPIPWPKRTAENIAIGAPAWLSFDGKIAHPVRVVGMDDRGYSVEPERAARGFQRGIYSLFHDEIRSTPELACENMVTL